MGIRHVGFGLVCTPAMAVARPGHLVKDEPRDRDTSIARTNSPGQATKRNIRASWASTYPHPDSSSSILNLPIER